MREEYSSPFFVIGNPRSGTSLLRLMLNAHPEITVPPECGFAMWLYPRYRDENLSRLDVLERFAEDVFVARKFETWNLPLESFVRDIKFGRYESYSDLAEAVYRAYARNNGKVPKIVGDKNNYYINCLNDLKSAFPSSKLVFIIRDGRDVASSYLQLARKGIDSKYRPNLPDKIELIAQEWRSTCERICMYSGEQTITVFYEALLRDPVHELERICRHLGLGYRDEMLRYYEKNDEPPEFLQWKKKTLQPPDMSNAGKFMSALPSEAIARFERVAGRTLQALGYSLMST